MARQETSLFILFIGGHPFIYHTLFINELKGGTLGNVPINHSSLSSLAEEIDEERSTHDCSDDSDW